MKTRRDVGDIIFHGSAVVLYTIAFIVITARATGRADDAYHRGVIAAQTGDVYVEQIGTKHGGPVWGPVVRKEEE